MSHLMEIGNNDQLKFSWGKKRGKGGRKKDVQFYESFTYDGMDYDLYDCVYLFGDGESEPFVGKIIKIWENSDNSKKIKVLWFFRPCEIMNWLGEEGTPENEVFLASGEGPGLANVNPLEAIAGKCNVVCTSKDTRNPQLSEEEVHLADFIFYRTFDVVQCKVLETIGDKIAGIDASYFFNRKKLQELCSALNSDSDRKNGREANNAILPIQSKLEGRSILSADSNQGTIAEEDAVIIKQSEVTLAEKDAGVLKADKKQILDGYSSTDDLSEACLKKDADALNDALLEKDTVIIKNDDELNATSAKTYVGDKNRTPGDVVAGAAGGDKMDTSIKEDLNLKPSLVKQKTVVGKSSLMSKVELDKRDGKIRKVLENVKSLKSSGELDSRPIKKAKLESSMELHEDNKSNNVQNLNAGFDGTTARSSLVVHHEDNMQSKLANDLVAKDNLLKKLKPDEKMTKPPNGNLTTASILKSQYDEDGMVGGRVVQVTRRPEVDRSRWFKQLPWEARMRSAHEKGMLVLLENLDPTFTSAEVEDIIWHGFKESCTAKMIQHTAFSNPHTGQAFVILKTREAAEKIVEKLQECCLMVPGGRPLLGSIAAPCFPGKETALVGHIYLEKAKALLQREMKEAVSTSHCSQPNTIEYEMAMEWCLQQEISDSCWKKLHKQQGEELNKVKAELKPKCAALGD